MPRAERSTALIVKKKRKVITLRAKKKKKKVMTLRVKKSITLIV